MPNTAPPKTIRKTSVAMSVPVMCRFYNGTVRRAILVSFALIARDHRAGEVLPEDEAREDDCGDVRQHESERDVGDHLVHILQSLAGRLAHQPGERARLLIATINDEAGDDRGREKQEQRDDHGTAGRTMSEVPRRPERYEVAKIPKRLRGPVDEIS